MKKVLSAIFILSVSGLVIYFLQAGIPSKGVPPAGKLLSPFSGVWTAAEAPEFSDKSIKMELEAPVSVVYDKRLVPHVTAQNLKDALKVQGYIEASHRLWQMEISVRAAAGELSEILGIGKDSAILKKDLLERRKGTRRAAELDVEAWKKNPESLALCQAYVDGVNAYVESLSPEDYPIEYKLTNNTPRKWELLHSALFAQNMSTTLASRNYDIEDTNFAAIFGMEEYNNLFAKPNPKQDPVIPSEHTWNFNAIKTEANERLTVIPHQPAWHIEEGIGSNNWAISGEKTASGFPILCNDPHLKLTVPSIWFELQINLPENKIHGVSLPGIPGIVIGFNKQAAWGTTNVGQDVLDWYRIDWVDDSKQAYWVDSQQVAVQEIIEEIKIKNGTVVFDTIQQTIWGPVVHKDPDHPKFDLAMKWVMDMQTKPLEPVAFVRLMQTGSVAGFFEAMVDYSGPAQNFIYATKTNELAIQCKGNYPLRKENQGRFVQNGNSKENDWKGIVPADHIPMDINPERGFVASANQVTTDSTYPYFYFGGFDNYRGRLINRLLGAIEPGTATAEDMMRMQNNNYSIEAEEVLPVLLEQLALADSTRVKEPMYQALASWQYTFDPDLIEPTYYKRWWDTLQFLVWDEIKAQEDQGVALRKPKSWRTLELIQEDPENIFFDWLYSSEREHAGDMVLISFDIVNTLLNQKKKEQLIWFKELGAQIPNLTRIAGFGVDYVKTGGYKYAINANKGKFGPSWRMVVELGDNPTGYVVYPGGQSGNPGSPYYDNMVGDWTIGRYYTVHLNEPIENPLFELTFSK